MCGRFYIVQLYEEVAARFGVTIPGWTSDIRITPRFNAAPGQRIAAVRATGSARELAAPKWGLIPRWSNDDAIASKTANARSETAHEKPSFREAFAKRRCLIPASGFYEWKQTASGKQPVAVHLEDEPLYAMAGLWETWRDPATGTDLDTATVLTCEANDFIAGMHPRMPVILPDSAWERWLDPGTTTDDARGLCRPLPAGRMTSHAVSRRVNDVKNDDRSLIQPVEADPGGLFEHSG
ncbi:MAG: SOS response-associated peptidase [Planctomycetota bacterium]